MANLTWKPHTRLKRQEFNQKKKEFKLYILLTRTSQLSKSMNILKSIRTYGPVIIFVIIKCTQSFQSKGHGTIVDSSYCVTEKTSHHYLNIPYLPDHILKLSLAVSQASFNRVLSTFQQLICRMFSSIVALMVSVV